MNCPKCGVALSKDATVCPKCNSAVECEVVEITPTDAPNQKAVGAALGFCSGILGFVFLVIIATYLVMSGYHYEYAFAAIAICFPVATMIRGIFLFRQGKCPYCNKFMNGYPRNGRTLKCKKCKHQVLYKDDKFRPVAE